MVNFLLHKFVRLMQGNAFGWNIDLESIVENNWRGSSLTITIAFNVLSAQLN